jgi:hypothetical protein
MAELRALVIAGSDAQSMGWRYVDLRDRVARRFGVTVAERGVGTWLCWCERREAVAIMALGGCGSQGMGKLKNIEARFTGRHFDREVIILRVRWFCACAPSVAVPLAVPRSSPRVIGGH